VYGIQHYMDVATSSPPDTVISSSSANSSPSQWAQLGFQAMADTNRLLTTLATGLLGALGLLLSNKSRDRLPKHLWSAFLCAMTTTLSLYYGYVGHLHLLGMIYSENFDPFGSASVLPSHSQFYTLLAGVFFLADFTFHNLIKGI
jgi:hypothetical protein